MSGSIKSSGTQKVANRATDPAQLALADAATKHRQTGAPKLAIAAPPPSRIPVGADAAKLTGLLDEFRSAILDATTVGVGGQAQVDVDKIKTAMAELTAKGKEPRGGNAYGALGDQGHITILNITNALENPDFGHPGFKKDEPLAFVDPGFKLENVADVAKLFHLVVDHQLPAMISVARSSNVAVDNVEAAGLNPKLMLSAEELADSVACPGISRMIRDGLDVGADGEVDYQKVIGAMQKSFGYTETHARFLIGVFGSTTGTTGALAARKDNNAKGSFNIADLADPRNFGQHTRSLPFRRDDGTIDEPIMSEALDKHCADGTVSLWDVAKMVHEFKQPGVVTGQDPKDAPLAKRALGALIGERQTEGEVMLLFTAYADKGGMSMPRARFEQLMRGKIPDDMATAPGGGLGKWLLQTTAMAALGLAADVRGAFTALFGRSDPIAAGAEVAMGNFGPDASAAMQSAGAAAGCPAMKAGMAATENQARTPGEVGDVQSHQAILA